MSRSRKKSKGAGHEYWSRRPTPSTKPGRPAKKLTHRAERRQGKKGTE